MVDIKQEGGAIPILPPPAPAPAVLATLVDLEEWIPLKGQAPDIRKARALLLLLPEPAAQVCRSSTAAADPPESDDPVFVLAADRSAAKERDGGATATKANALLPLLLVLVLLLLLPGVGDGHVVAKVARAARIPQPLVMFCLLLLNSLQKRQEQSKAVVPR